MKACATRPRAGGGNLGSLFVVLLAVSVLLVGVAEAGKKKGKGPAIDSAKCVGALRGGLLEYREQRRQRHRCLPLPPAACCCHSFWV